VTASPCAVIGGGEVAERKVRGLVERGAEVTVISASASEEIAALAASGAIKWNRRPWRAGDLAGFEMVFCTLNDPEAARMAAAEARKLGTPINVADQPELCTFIAPAVVRRGDLQIAISTSGASPALAARIRAALEREFGAEYATAIIVLRAARAFMREREPDVSERSRRLGALVERDIASIIRTGDGAALDRTLRETVGADLAALGIAHGALFAPAPARTRP
jgi:precorrin-2 dehydrogenase/sirohydrochlorin ferrochelatase